MSPALAWFRRAMFAGTCVLGGVATVSAQIPSGDAFRVNTQTVGSQWRPAVASDPQGRFLVVWRDDGQSDAGPGIFGRHFASSGVAGPELTLDTQSAGSPQPPAVASAGNGRFLVVWNGVGPGDGDGGIFGRRVDANGVPQGASFLVNTDTSLEQVRPAVAMASDGRAIVTWWSGARIKARRFDASGAAAGDEFVVATASGMGGLSSPAVDFARPGTAFTIAWSDSNQFVDARQFSADATPLGPAFSVSGVDPDGYLILGPQVAGDDQERMLVTWGVLEGFENVATAGRWIDSAGSLSPEIEMVPSAANTPNAGRLSMVPSGDFIVTWSAYSAGSYDGSPVTGSRFAADGTAQGDVTLAPAGSAPMLAQRRPSDVRDFVVVWSEYGDAEHDVWGRLFRAEPQFEDGFESGDTSAWSLTVP